MRKGNCTHTKCGKIHVATNTLKNHTKSRSSGAKRGPPSSNQKLRSGHSKLERVLEPNLPQSLWDFTAARCTMGAKMPVLGDGASGPDCAGAVPPPSRSHHTRQAHMADMVPCREASTWSPDSVYTHACSVSTSGVCPQR